MYLSPDPDEAAPARPPETAPAPAWGLLATGRLGAALLAAAELAAEARRAAEGSA